MQLNRAFHMADRWRIYSTRPMQRPAPIYDIEHTGRRLAAVWVVGVALIKLAVRP